MDIPFYIWHIVLEILATIGAVFGAEQVNSCWKLPEDEYLPRKKMKLSKFFVLISKNKPVRWRAYVMHRVAQISFILYFIILLLGRIFTGSFDFVHETIFLVYPIPVVYSRLIWEIGVFIYIKYKKRTSSSK